MDEEEAEPRAFDNIVLEETSLWLSHELKERIAAAAADGPDAVKNTILEMLREEVGISEDDWKRMLQGNVYAFEVEKKHGLSFQASVNACMYTNFLLGYFMAKNLNADSDTIPAEWLDEKE